MSLSHDGVVVDPIQLVVRTGYEPVNRDHHLQNELPTCHHDTPPLVRALARSGRSVNLPGVAKPGFRPATNLRRGHPFPSCARTAEPAPTDAELITSRELHVSTAPPHRLTAASPPRRRGGLRRDAVARGA